NLQVRGPSPSARLGMTVGTLTRKAFQYLLVGREFFHEHEQTLDRFSWFVPREPAPDQIDFLELPRLHEQLFAARAGKENVHRRVNALIADLTVEYHLHVPGPFEFLEDQFIHPAARFDQRRRHDRERA